jgi:hypothetical protein
LGKRADADGAGVGVDAVVDVVDLADVFVIAAVSQARVHRHRAVGAAVACRLLPAEREHVALVDIEVGVDRVPRDDRRQQGRLALADEVAGVDARLVDVSGDGRRDLRVAQVDLG